MTAVTSRGRESLGEGVDGPPARVGPVSDGRPNRYRWLYLLGYLVPPLLTIGLWQYLSGRLFSVPTPSDTVRMVGELWESGRLWEELYPTLKAIMLGFCYAVLLGTALGAFVGSNRFLAETYERVMYWVFITPKVVFYPLLLGIFGLTIESRVAFAAVIGMWPVAMNVFTALRTMNERQLAVARSFGATPSKTIVSVYIPSITPAVVAAMRQAWAICVATVIVGEVFASRLGAGRVIVNSSEIFQFERAFAFVLVLFAVTLMGNILLSAIGRSVGIARATRHSGQGG